MSDDQNVDELVKVLLKLKKTGKEPLVLPLNQTATETVAGSRGHWHAKTLVSSKQHEAWSMTTSPCLQARRSRSGREYIAQTMLLLR